MSERERELNERERELERRGDELEARGAVQRGRAAARDAIGRLTGSEAQRAKGAGVRLRGGCAAQ